MPGDLETEVRVVGSKIKWSATYFVLLLLLFSDAVELFSGSSSESPQTSRIGLQRNIVHAFQSARLGDGAQ